MNKVNKLLLRLMHANSYDLDPDPGDGGPWRFITTLMDCWSACQVRQKKPMLLVILQFVVDGNQAKLQLGSYWLCSSTYTINHNIAINLIQIQDYHCFTTCL